MQQKHQSERELVDDKITGVSIFIRNPIGAAAVKDIESALMVAMVFGVTSPKISIKNVRIPVAIPAPVFPKRWMAREVEMEDAERFTMLFPIRMADNIFPDFRLHAIPVQRVYRHCLQGYAYESGLRL